MKFGCNYSEELLEVIEKDGDIVDYIKMGAFHETYDLLDKALTYKPILLHGFGWHERLGMKDAKNLDFKYMNQMLMKYGSPHLGIHALAFLKDDGNLGKEGVLRRMIENYKYFHENIKQEIVLENMDFSPFYTRDATIKASTQPDFVQTLFRETKAGVLLDMAHAKVSAYHLKIPYEKYLEMFLEFPIKEIHASGTTYVEGQGLKDSHDKMKKEDMEVLKWLKYEAKPAIITLEFGDIRSRRKIPFTKNELEEQLLQIKEL